MKTLFLLTVVAIIVLSCSKQSPQKSSVDVDTLANVYAELLVLNERYSLAKDSLSAQQYESDYGEVLRRHDYTTDRFVSELGSVSQSPDSFRQLCDRALTKFQEMRRKPSPVETQGRS
jgi:hypothetical protein